MASFRGHCFIWLHKGKAKKSEGLGKRLLFLDCQNTLYARVLSEVLVRVREQRISESCLPANTSSWEGLGREKKKGEKN